MSVSLEKKEKNMAVDYKKKVTMDASAFVLLAEFVPAIIQEIRYYSTYNFVGERRRGYRRHREGPSGSLYEGEGAYPDSRFP